MVQLNGYSIQSPEPLVSSVEETDLLTLVSHSEWVKGEMRLVDVYQRFKEQELDFYAVKEGDRKVSLCSRGRVGFLMGHRFGFSVYGQQAIREHLVEEPLIIRRGTPIREVLETALGREGKRFNEDVLLVDEAGGYLGMITVPSLVRLQSALVAERFRTQEVLHRKLLSVSRQAGMAEVATGILHNVGNVLNSVNVSALLVGDLIRGSRVETLGKVAGLLQDHRADLGQYLTTDNKGKLIPDLIQQLAANLTQQRADQLREMESLIKHVEHIKNIVAMQQHYAKISGVFEPVEMASLMEDALQLHASAFVRHGIKVECRFDKVPPIMADRHKILQILVNLLRNAKDALDHGPGGEKQLTLSIQLAAGQRVRIQVTDNGVGIPPENLDRIFAHGFTTKKDGHGFGLHTCALAAKEMGGSLVARSEGPGKGATFILELPIERRADQN